MKQHILNMKPDESILTHHPVNHSKTHFMINQFLINMTLFIAMVFAAWNANAGQLWNNGDTDGSATLGWGSHSSILDDFYVPGGGWWINHLETTGIFVDPLKVADVEVAVWSHDMTENEPDGDSVDVLHVNKFTATPTGRTFFDRKELKISVDFDKTYLKGQRYYWIEISVRDQYGLQSFKFLARQGVSHEPSWTHFGQGSLLSSGDLYGQDLDLSYVLYGTPVTLSHFTGPVDGFQVQKRDDHVVIDVAQKSATKSFGFVMRCPAGSSLVPFKKPIYDKKGLWVIGYETVWYCIPDDLEPEG